MEQDRKAAEKTKSGSDQEQEVDQIGHQGHVKIYDLCLQLSFACFVTQMDFCKVYTHVISLLLCSYSQEEKGKGSVSEHLFHLLNGVLRVGERNLPNLLF